MSPPVPDKGPGGDGLVADILHAWRGLEPSIERMRARAPEESQLLIYVFIAAFIGFVTGLPGAARQAEALGDAGSMSAIIGGRLFSAVFVAPLVLYGLAGISGLVARRFGLDVSYRGARLAFFWALLVATPLLIVSGLVSGFLPPGPVAQVLQLAVMVGFFWIWATFLASVAERPAKMQIFIFFMGLVAAIFGLLLSFS